MKYILFALFLSITPLVSQAYITTEQHAFTVDGEIGVFTIDYAFGHTKHPLLMPLRALKNPPEGDLVLGYEIVDESGVAGTGEAYAVILSDLPPQKGTYEIKKDTEATFRLLVLYKRTSSEAGKKFTLKVTSFPFDFKNTAHLKLNPSELRYYVTPPLLLSNIVVTPLSPKG